ncbi:GNAT family N-acetyltransferase [Alkalihalophilus marmarensis]|jgi:ribosomal protein S18 acetylase RimI-like enzyme|uniref:N-acetyltransferase domain-containing protein n=1 Tax=Alkalihalophilus marmarensis DSM 21297 TaxID=1188261 RepID=U6SQS8_9BACI|nr:GNAT family N-acetyltransferase [Alkalihalophilus marmarensis]ERN53953.1 hypothetical protein A33I_09115 [Alkalihalophilus marmarensis DSM 21297]MCM3491123.1 GNAT family N-acetyltransferase [Alkalihalophilus marmarensis]
MASCNKSILDLVEFVERDIPQLVELSTSVGWDYDERELKTVLASGNIFGHKDLEERIVSSAAIIPYGRSLASIGMVIVHEDYRGMGLGEEATKRCIEDVTTDTPIMLIATKEGSPLYKKMGFNSVGYVDKYICDHYMFDHDPLLGSNTTIEEYSGVDMDAIYKLDERAFGATRTRFLKIRMKQAEQIFVAKDDQGAIVGYGLSISGPVHLILGPIVARDFQVASGLIDKLAINHQGKIRIDVPLENNEFMMFLNRRGFVNVNRPPIMVINSDSLPTRNNTLFSIAAQVFG